MVPLSITLLTKIKDVYKINLLNLFLCIVTQSFATLCEKNFLEVQQLVTGEVPLKTHSCVVKIQICLFESNTSLQKLIFVKKCE